MALGRLSARGGLAGCTPGSFCAAVAVGVAVGAAACATPSREPAAGPPPSVAPRVDDDLDRVDGGVEGRITEGRLADHLALAELTTRLGAPLPAPTPGDELGVEEPAFEVTRAFVAGPTKLGGAPARVRATAWRGRVHTLELTFVEGCSPRCMARISAALAPWSPPCTYVVEGRARLCALDVDTVRFTLEDYPARPASRVLIACRPLVAASSGRPAVLPEVGERAVPDRNPVCRSLAPSPLLGP